MYKHFIVSNYSKTFCVHVVCIISVQIIWSMIVLTFLKQSSPVYQPKWVDSPKRRSLKIIFRRGACVMKGPYSLMSIGSLVSIDRSSNWRRTSSARVLALLTASSSSFLLQFLASVSLPCFLVPHPTSSYQVLRIVLILKYHLYCLQFVLLTSTPLYYSHSMTGVEITLPDRLTNSHHRNVLGGVGLWAEKDENAKKRNQWNSRPK